MIGVQERTRSFCGRRQERVERTREAGAKLVPVDVLLMELVVASLVDLVPVFAVTLRTSRESALTGEIREVRPIGARTLVPVALTARQRSVIEVIEAVLSEPALLEALDARFDSSSTRRPSS